MISILMPFKNEELHLEQAVHSVLNQSFTNFELIMINDHSTDSSSIIALKLQKQDSRLKILENNGQGIIDALRTGQKQINGSYVSRQDADDIMPKDKLETLKKILDDSGENSIATGKVKYFSDGILGDGHKKYEKWINSFCDKNNHYDSLFKECVLVSSNWLMTTLDFNKINGYIDSIYPEDYHFVFKLFDHGLKVKSSKKVTHLWRDHENRASRTLIQYQDQKFFNLKVYYFKKYFSDKNIILWGAGKTGKKLSKELIAQKLNFTWITNNEKKIGKNIYDNMICPIEEIFNIKDPYIIISVTQRGAMSDIQSFLENNLLLNYYEF